MQDSDLDDLFATARSTPLAVSPALTARVLADAQRLQPVAVQPVAPKPGFWAGFLAAIGGAPAVAGLSTAALAGLWIGFAQPMGLASVTDVLVASTALAEPLDVMPAYDDFLTEG